MEADLARLRVLHKKGQDEECIQFAKEVLGRNPSCKVAYVCKAWAEFKLNRFLDAHSTLQDGWVRLSDSRNGGGLQNSNEGVGIVRVEERLHWLMKMCESLISLEKRLEDGCLRLANETPALREWYVETLRERINQRNSADVANMMTQPDEWKDDDVFVLFTSNNPEVHQYGLSLESMGGVATHFAETSLFPDPLNQSTDGFLFARWQSNMLAYGLSRHVHPPLPFVDRQNYDYGRYRRALSYSDDGFHPVDRFPKRKYLEKYDFVTQQRVGADGDVGDVAADADPNAYRIASPPIKSSRWTSVEIETLILMCDRQVNDVCIASTLPNKTFYDCFQKIVQYREAKAAGMVDAFRRANEGQSTAAGGGGDTGVCHTIAEQASLAERLGGPLATIAFQPHPECDVYEVHNALSEQTRCTLKWHLGKLGEIYGENPFPMYFNTIDPNMTTYDDHWVPTDWEVEEHPIDVREVTVSLLLCASRALKRSTGPRWIPEDIVRDIIHRVYSTSNGTSHNVALRAKIVTPVPLLDIRKNLVFHHCLEELFNAALPCLYRLKRPSLLLPGPLQVVVKAQSVFLAEGEEYEGVWHQDGLQESIVAVAVYYYDVDNELEGGAMEFFDKRSREFWVGGDCNPDTLTKEDVKDYLRRTPHCKVDVKTGTMVVFSNYQCVHRVLKMIRNSDGSRGVARRDFVLFFIVDQRRPLPCNSAMFAKSHNATLSLQSRRKIRDKRMEEQLKPAGKFGVNEGTVYSTGNGSVAQLGFASSGHVDKDRLVESSQDRSALDNFEALNFNPPLNRGVSWAVTSEGENAVKLVDALESDTNPESCWAAVYREEAGGVKKLIHFLNFVTDETSKETPVEGICCSYPE